MTDNRSLDEFAAPAEDADDGLATDDTRSPEGPSSADSGAAEEPESDDEASGAAEATGRDGQPGGEASDLEGEDGSVEPVASTYVWSPEAGTCADCGGTVEERWRDGDHLVCSDCKEW